MHQRTQIQRQQDIIELAAQRRMAGRYFETFDGVDQAHHFLVKMGNTRVWRRAVTSQNAGHFNRPVCRDIVDMTVMRHVHVMFSLLIIVNRVDHFAGRVGIVRPTAQLKLFRFDVQLWIFIQIKQLFFDLLHHLRSRAAFIVLAHFNRQHLFLLKVVEQVRARQQIQGTNQPFTERQIEDIFH
ncbi:hypothetical protein D1872_266800 [compost metagenome]